MISSSRIFGNFEFSIGPQQSALDQSKSIRKTMGIDKGIKSKIIQTKKNYILSQLYFEHPLKRYTIKKYHR
eukprot:snap_masked-scaffold_30-processed-gene-1.29-mRNA-1 protein AED:1.00 eAED:1.00 QI:0/0/0/0/1/1/2/0/70